MARGKGSFKALGLVVGLALLFHAVSAHAAIDSANILDNVLARYQSAASMWATYITGRATWLFWCLVTISLTWTFGIMALKQADYGEFFAEFIRFSIFTGFFWWLLVNGPNFAVSIMDSMRQIAASASGLSSTLSPSGIVDIGFGIVNKVIDQSSLWSPVDSAMGILIAIGVLLVLLVIGVNMVLLLCSGWVLAYGGVFFLGFGGSRWTSDMAVNYYKTVLSVAVSLFAMVLLVGVGKTFLDDYYSRMSAGISLKEMVVLLGAAVVLLFLTNGIPALLTGIITGAAIGNNGGIGGYGAGLAFGAAGMAMGAAAAGGAMAMAGATQLAGGASAVMAAVSKASENMSNGTGMFAGVGGAMSSALNAAGGGGGASDGAGASPLASAMGGAGGATASAATGTVAPAAAHAETSSDGGAAEAGVATSPDGAGPAGSPDAAGPSTEAASQSASAEQPGAAAAGAGEGTKGAPQRGRLRAAASTAGRFAADVGVNLARGVGTVTRERANEALDAATARIGDTFGGRVADAIRKSGEPSFQDGSLGAAESGEVDAKSEIEAFVNKDLKESQG